MSHITNIADLKEQKALLEERLCTEIQAFLEACPIAVDGIYLNLLPTTFIGQKQSYEVSVKVHITL